MYVSNKQVEVEDFFIRAAVRALVMRTVQVRRGRSGRQQTRHEEVEESWRPLRSDEVALSNRGYEFPHGLVVYHEEPSEVVLRNNAGSFPLPEGRWVLEQFGDDRIEQLGSRASLPGILRLVQHTLMQQPAVPLPEIADVR